MKTCRASTCIGLQESERWLLEAGLILEGTISPMICRCMKAVGQCKEGNSCRTRTPFTCNKLIDLLDPWLCIYVLCTGTFCKQSTQAKYIMRCKKVSVLKRYQTKCSFLHIWKKSENYQNSLTNPTGEKERQESQKQSSFNSCLLLRLLPSKASHVLALTGGRLSACMQCLHTLPHSGLKNLSQH